MRPVAQAAARLKEAAKLGFARAVVPQGATNEAGGEGGLALNGVQSLAELAAEIAALGTPSPRADRRAREP